MNTFLGYHSDTQIPIDTSLGFKLFFKFVDSNCWRPRSLVKRRLHGALVLAQIKPYFRLSLAIFTHSTPSSKEGDLCVAVVGMKQL